MPREMYLYDAPERFVVGTVGQPGERTFFLQARSGARITSVALEKVQVAVLAERLEQVLDELVLRSGGTAPVPAAAPAELDDIGPLEQPIVEEFRVGTLALAWDAEQEMVIIEAQAVSDEDEESLEEALGEGAEEETEGAEEDEPSAGQTGLLGDDEDGPPVLRVRISGAHARAFTKRALQVVAAGRPPCPFCGLPLDSEGHVCPRQNGYRGA